MMFLWGRGEVMKLLLWALTLCLRHALANVLCLFFALPQRIGEERAPRGSPLDPLGRATKNRRFF